MPSCLNGELDGTVREELFGDGVVLPPGFDFGFLDGIALQKSIELLPPAPATFKVVVGYPRCAHITHHRIPPLRESHLPPGGRAAEELRFAVDRLRKLKPITRRPNGDEISNFGVDLNNV